MSLVFCSNLGLLAVCAFLFLTAHLLPLREGQRRISQCEVVTMQGCMALKKGRILVYIGNSPIYLDPFSVMYFSDKDDLIDPKEYQNGNR